MATTTKCASSGTHTQKPEIWYDYDLQVWIKHNVVLECGHPIHMLPNCCNAERYACMFVWEARKLAGLCACEDCVAAQWRQR